MEVTRDRSGFVVLDRQACLAQLATHRVAALAITEGALPMVLPVFYTLEGEDVLVRAASVGVLGRRLPGSVVSLCVHETSDDLSSGWSVTVTGEAVEVEAPTTDVPRPPWQPGTPAITVRISTDIVSGRRIPDPLLSS